VVAGPYRHVLSKLPPIEWLSLIYLWSVGPGLAFSNMANFLAEKWGQSFVWHRQHVVNLRPPKQTTRRRIFQPNPFFPTLFLVDGDGLTRWRHVVTARWRHAVMARWRHVVSAIFGLLCVLGLFVHRGVSVFRNLYVVTYAIVSCYRKASYKCVDNIAKCSFATKFDHIC
jgi:hypothetical protein